MACQATGNECVNVRAGEVILHCYNDVRAGCDVSTVVCESSRFRSPVDDDGYNNALAPKERVRELAPHNRSRHST